jgi:hypothetical protein
MDSKERITVKKIFFKKLIFFLTQALANSIHSTSAVFTTAVDVKTSKRENRKMATKKAAKKAVKKAAKKPAKKAAKKTAKKK